MKKIWLLAGVIIVLAITLVGCSNPSEIESLAVESSTENSDDIDESSLDVAEDINEEVSVPEEPVAEESSKSDGPNISLMESLPDGRGSEIYFEDFKGKMLFVNFFGTWCTYCMQEMPDFQKFTEDYSEQANIVIVNALETEKIDMAGVVDWYEEGGYTMQMVFDEDRSRTADFYGAIQGFPTTFVFDENLEFIGYIPGMMDYAMLEGIVSEYGPK